MKRLQAFLLIFLMLPAFAFTQNKNAAQWADSVFNSLTNEQRIAQLMIVRAHSNLGQKHVNSVTELIKKYNVGALCFFQGGPVRQANLTNYYQSVAQTPLMITIDGEWGLGMRLDSVTNFPHQLMMGAMQDAAPVYNFGQAVAAQCRRMGIHVNYAPVVDVNNNPANPVINDRSFGENKYKVALFGIQYMKGMQDGGILACAKHFPGHGDVAVDSHLDLPVINKTRQQLDSLELYPFRQIFKEGVGSVMIAHLYIPSIDSTPNQATSLSNKTVTGLLKTEIGYNGLVFTDALEMQGVTKFYPSGKASVQALIAGNDMLCLPADVPESIKEVLKALKKGQLSWEDINARVKKVLVAKYNMGLYRVTPVDTTNLVADLNAQTNNIKSTIAANAITLVKRRNSDLLPMHSGKRLAYVGIGLEKENAFSNRMQKDYNAGVYLFSYKRDLGAVKMLVNTIRQKHDAVVIGLHNYSRTPANNFRLSAAAIQLINQLQSEMPSITFVFGNPYAIKNIDKGANIIACYEDDSITQQVAADVLNGSIVPKGKLPVTVTPEFKAGSGIVYNHYFPVETPEAAGFNNGKLSIIDSIANNAIKEAATPGCVVLVAKDQKVGFLKAYGYTNYDSIQPVSTETIYDLASVTKTSATTVSVMKLYEEGKLDLNKTLGDYLEWVRGSNKDSLKITDILLHQAGLVAWIPFFRETLDSAGKPLPFIYSAKKDEKHNIRVAEDLYMSNSWIDTIYARILSSPVSGHGNYVYSDLDFIFLGKIVEALTGKKLEDYAAETFYKPLQMKTTSFLPRDHFSLDEIAPTEQEKLFRLQLILGDVHDPAAAMLGGVAGHAGLFSNAYDLAQLYQMLLNGGAMNGVRYLKRETIELFTAYHSSRSRRGLGFDKPEKDNASRKDPYPALSVSSATFGHTGFTGTCVWADPEYNLLYIFLSNRVTPQSEIYKLSKMNVRSAIHEAIYQAMERTPNPITYHL